MIQINETTMKLILIIAMLFLFSGCGTKTQIKSEKTDYNISFNQVWTQVASDELQIMPYDKVSFFKLFSFKKDTLLKDSQRTLANHLDILEPFEKLAHPIGICFKGIWNIDTENIYSGYFKKSSQALIIARASSAMGNPDRGSKRSFGFAGKLFPTTNPNHQNTQYSANFFLIDDFGGTDAAHYTDVKLTNEPKLSFTFKVVQNLLYALKVSYTFSKVDENPSIRQLYEISELGESEDFITPKWMKLEAKENTKVDAKDFRDELKINNGETLIFNIFVANEIINTKKAWQKIGTITLDKSVVSKSCDHRLHFHHPKWRSDLNYGTTLSPKPF